MKIAAPKVPVKINWHSIFPHLDIKWRRIISIVGLLIFVLLIVAAFSSLRHRQICNYESLVGAQLAEYSGDTELCPNILSLADWPKIIINAFTLDINSYFTVATAPMFASDRELETCTDNLNPICWISGNSPQLDQTDGRTNLLIVGIDAKAGRMNQNTDTLMILSYDHASGNTLLLSFPRDLVVTYTRPNGGKTKVKINTIYFYDGMDTLKSAMTEITGKPIHYHVMLSIDTFIQAADKMGKITVDLPEPFGDVYPCSELPDGVQCPSPRFVQDGMYGYFSYPAGEQEFGSLEALVYSRARKYSSDFERARRQQLIVKSVIREVIRSSESDLISSVGKYIDLYKLFREQVDTNVQLEDAAGALALVRSMGDKTATIVADPNLGNGSVITYGAVGDRGVWENTFRDQTYKQFQDYIAKTWEFLPFYLKNPKVLVVEHGNATLSDHEQLDYLLSENNPYVTVKTTTADASNPSLTDQIKVYNLGGEGANGVSQVLSESDPSAFVYNADIDTVERSDFNEHIRIEIY